MNKNIKILIHNLINLKSTLQHKRFLFILVWLLGLLLLPSKQIRSEEIYLKCTGKYEINRGPLIQPDWETSFLTINLDGLISKIVEKGVKKEGRTLIRRSSYTITHRDDRNRVKNIFIINRTYGTYIFESPQRNRTLIGTCQKGRG